MSNPSLSVLALVLLASCVDPDAGKDRDSDGFLAFQAGGDDCNDADPAVNPGVDEVCGNDIDDDCDGLVDNDGVGAQLWYADVDEDTFGDPGVSVSACAAPTGYVADNTDCDDLAASVNPDATDTWYDGVDQDCDQADDYDQDGDGFRSAEHHDQGDDCNDRHPAVNPDATEVCGDFMDNDCDGGHGTCDWAGTAPTTGVLSWTGTPELFSSVGDADNDGSADLIAWQEEGNDLHVFFGPWTGAARDDDDAQVVLTLPDLDPGYDHAASMEQDISGDGGADLVVGSWDFGAAGTVRVFTALTAASGDLSQSNASITWAGPSDGASSSTNGYGHRVRALGTVDGASRAAVAFPYKSFSQGDRCFLVYDSATSGPIQTVADHTVDGCSDVVPGPLQQHSDRMALVRAGAYDYYLVATDGNQDPIDATDQSPVQIAPNLVDTDALRCVPNIDYDEQSTGYGQGEVLAIDRDTVEAAFRAVQAPLDDEAPHNWLQFISDDDAIEAFHDAHVGDINGDGLLDLLLLMDLDPTGEVGGTAIGVRYTSERFDGDSTADRTSFDALIDVPTGERYFTLLPGDFDGDGYTDVLLTGPGKLRVYYGAGW